MRLRHWTAVVMGGLAMAASWSAAGRVPERPKINIAHRGASAYAPEHTRAAYRLAIEQGADFVEPDLQITRDGVLICLHDETLERTTNVRDVFPDRGRRFEGRERAWPAADFTIDEIRQLDAGSWFDARFAGERVLTLQDAIDEVRGKAGLYPELKSPDLYARLGFDIERLFLDVLRRNGLDQPGADPATPIVVQSFSAPTLRRLAGDLAVRLPLVLLVDPPAAGRWLSPAGLDEAATFASGIGPAKRLLIDRPEVVALAHARGLTVTPYTFRSRGLTGWDSVEEEMAHYLYTLGVDAVFTDNPDKFPRRSTD